MKISFKAHFYRNSAEYATFQPTYRNFKRNHGSVGRSRKEIDSRMAFNIKVMIKGIEKIK